MIHCPPEIKHSLIEYWFLVVPQPMFLEEFVTIPVELHLSRYTGNIYYILEIYTIYIFLCRQTLLTKFGQQ